MKAPSQLYYAFLDYVTPWVQRYHAWRAERRQDLYDKRFLGAGHVLVTDVIEALGKIPVRPNELQQKVEVAFNRYVHPGEEWNPAISYIRTQYKAGKKILEVRMEQFGYHTIPLVMQMKQMWREAKENKLDCMLAQFDDIKFIDA